MKTLDERFFDGDITNKDYYDIDDLLPMPPNANEEEYDVCWHCHQPHNVYLLVACQANGGFCYSCIKNQVYDYKCECGIIINSLIITQWEHTNGPMVTDGFDPPQCNLCTRYKERQMFKWYQYPHPDIVLLCAKRCTVQLPDELWFIIMGYMKYS